ncbi:MAG: DNA methyltransferase, partial [Candidatus Marinimicrobia bacterium]|nr:DNA methyltransferase [Candidatus Neomarinimicrobiota bacterium]MBL7109804.1 DNA methyltransferase [Candidatus Neomarinimicrobiota bacterium]
MGYEEASQLDNELMGGKKINPNSQFNSNTLNEKIDSIASKDGKRVKDVVSFYVDYQKSIKNISKVVKKGGFASYIVGNRRVKDETLPTDEITREFFEDNGFKHIDTLVRNIPHKRMPARNSPTNVVGKLSTTMNHEYIVVMQKY